MSESNSNTIVQNALSNNHIYGITLLSSSNNVISNNSINANEEFAVLLRNNANNNTFTFNTFSGNAKLAVYNGYSSKNRFYLNEFVNNSAGILSTNRDIVNSTEQYVYTYSGATYSNYLGNYYSDYKGVDNAGNGIGDTPTTTGDACPLVHPVGQYEKVQLISATVAEGTLGTLAVPALIIFFGIIASIIIVLKLAPKRNE